MFKTPEVRFIILTSNKRKRNDEVVTQNGCAIVCEVYVCVYVWKCVCVCGMEKPDWPSTYLKT